MDVDVSGVSNIVSVSSGCTLLNAVLRGAHRNSGGGAPLANAGTVQNLLCGTGAAPLAFVAANGSSSGTAPSNLNSYVEGTITVETPAIVGAGGTLFIQGKYTGVAPSSVTVAFDGASYTALTNFSAGSGYYSGTIAAPAIGLHTLAAQLGTTGVTSTSRTFMVASASASSLLGSQFIPSESGFATTLGAYAGTGQGNVGNS